MSAAGSLRRLRRENVHRLRQAEPELSHRQIAERLGISKDTVRRDLTVARAVTAGPGAPAAPQARRGGAEPQAPAAPPSDGTDAPSAPVAQPDQGARALPRRTHGPLDGIDVSRSRALRRDLAVLAQSGMAAEALVHQAVVTLAFTYRQALDRGDIEAGQAFLISTMTLTPSPVARRTGQAG